MKILLMTKKGNSMKILLMTKLKYLTLCAFAFSIPLMGMMTPEESTNSSAFSIPLMGMMTPEESTNSSMFLPVYKPREAKVLEENYKLEEEARQNEEERDAFESRALGEPYGITLLPLPNSILQELDKMLNEKALYGIMEELLKPPLLQKALGWEELTVLEQLSLDDVPLGFRKSITACLLKAAIFYEVLAPDTTNYRLAEMTTPKAYRPCKVPLPVATPAQLFERYIRNTEVTCVDEQIYSRVMMKKQVALSSLRSDELFFGAKLQYNPDPNYRKACNFELRKRALAYDYPRMLRESDLHFRNKVTQAARDGQIRTVELAFNYLQGIDGRWAVEILKAAVSGGQVEIAQFILDNIKRKDPETLETALVEAIRIPTCKTDKSGNPLYKRMIKILLPWIPSPSEEGFLTPFRFSHHPEIASFLLQTTPYKLTMPRAGQLLAMCAMNGDMYRIAEIVLSECKSQSQCRLPEEVMKECLFYSKYPEYTELLLNPSKGGLNPTQDLLDKVLLHNATAFNVAKYLLSRNGIRPSNSAIEQKICRIEEIMKEVSQCKGPDRVVEFGRKWKGILKISKKLPADAAGSQD